MRLIWWFVLLQACGGGEAAPPEAEDPPAAASTEALCEHRVVEALCPKCNPALAAVYRARGNWCAEHGYPESFCPVCHPERGGRPDPEVGVAADAAPAHGTVVRFRSPEIADVAGIRVVQAEARASGLTIAAPGRIVYDATRVALVNARASGVIRSISADVGARVEPGTPLAIVESAGMGADQARVRASRARLDLAQANLARLTALREQRAGTERDVIAARQEVEAARGEVAASQASLRILGPAGGGAGRYALTAPIAGVVVRRAATVGTLVGTEERLFEIVDTTTMWAEIDVPEDAVARVAVGQRASLRVDVLGEAERTGTIAYVAPEIDPHTRTAVARVALPNPDGLLRANMFAEARIEVDTSREAVSVPRAAVQRAADVRLVFVRLATDRYEARRVRLGVTTEDAVEILEGVRAGEAVVTEGSFLLKTETLRGSIGAGCCDVEER